MASTESRTDLLRKFLLSLKTTWGILSLIWTFVPKFIALLNASLIPPWPDQSAFLTGMICALAILWIFFILRDQGKARQRSWGSFLVVLTIAGFLAWMTTNAIFVVPMEEHNVVKGFSLQKTASKRIDEGLVAGTPVDLLNGFGEKSPELVWTCVPLARILVFFAFVLFFSGVAARLSALTLQYSEGNALPARADQSDC